MAEAFLVGVHVLPQARVSNNGLVAACQNHAKKNNCRGFKKMESRFTASFTAGMAKGDLRVTVP